MDLFFFTACVRIDVTGFVFTYTAALCVIFGGVILGRSQNNSKFSSYNYLYFTDIDCTFTVR